jgi:tetratricopeptide (TPR) repeat protein
VAWDEAVAFYDLAVEALDADDEDPRTRSELLAARGYTQHYRGEEAAGRDDALAAAEAARSVGDARLLAAAGIAYQGFSGQWASLADPIAVELMREGLASIPPDDLVPRAKTMAALAGALLVTPGDEALILAEEAEQLARAAGDDDALATALGAWSWALRSRGRGEELCRVSALGVDHAQAHHRLDWELVPHYNLAIGLLTLGRIDEGRRIMDQATNLPSSLKGWAGTVLEAAIAQADGRLDEAEVLIERGSELGASLGETRDAVRAIQHTRLELERLRFDEAALWADRADQTAWGPVIPWKIIVRAEQGDPDSADDFDRFDRDNLPLAPIVVADQLVETRTRLALLVGGHDRAARVRETAAAYPGELVGSDTFLYGPAEGVIGALLTIEGRYDEAVPLLERALALIERQPLRALIARHQIDLARALKGRAGPDDTDRAISLLNKASDAADALGLAATAKVVRELLG